MVKKSLGALKILLVVLLSFLVTILIINPSSMVFADTGKIVDDLNDYTKMVQHDGNSSFVTDNPGNFNGDASRLVNTVGGSVYAEYKTPKDMTTFTVDAYEKANKTTDSMKFYVSGDGTTYNAIPVNKMGEAPYAPLVFGFENGISDWAFWSGGGKPSSASDQAQEGSKSMLLDNGSSGKASLSVWKDIIPDGNGKPFPGDYIKLSAWIKLGNDASVPTGNSLVLKAVWFDSAGTKITPPFVTASVPSNTQTGQWVKIETNIGQIPAGATKLTMAIENSLPGKVYVDNVQVIKELGNGGNGEWSMYQYSPSSAIPAGTKYLKVELNKGLATSFVPYTISNMGFESGSLIGWSTWKPTGTNATFSVVGNVYQEGTKSLQIDMGTSASISVWHDVDVTGAAGMPARGDTIKVGAWVKLASNASQPAGKPFKLKLTNIATVNADLASVLLPTNTPLDQWTYIETGLAQVTADATKLTVAIEEGWSGTVYVDNVQLLAQRTAATDPGIQIGRVEADYAITPPVVTNASIDTFVNSTVSGAVYATDPGNETFSFSIKINASHGTAVLNANGSWTYTPNPDFKGDDSFTVKVTNEDGASADSTINIKVKDLFTIESISFTDLLGNSISELTPSSSLNAHMSIRNNTAEAKKATLIVALYDANKSVKKYAYVEDTIDPGQVVSLNGGFDLPDNVDGYFVKAFVWDSLQLDPVTGAGMKLMSNVFRFPYNIDFESGAPENFIKMDGFSFTRDNSEIIAGQVSMKGDTTGLATDWNEFFYTDKGVLKPGTDYIVSFDYKIVSIGGQGSPYLYTLFRSKSLNDTVQFKPLTGTPGKVNHFETKVSIGSKDDYALILGIFKKGVAVIDNIKLEETSLTGYTTAVRNTAPVTKQLTLPQGPGEIIIDAPNPAQVLVLNAADYGVSESNSDNRAAFQSAIDDAKARHASKLIVPSGVYHIRSGNLDFGEFTDFEFDGQGSELIFGKYAPDFKKMIYIHDSLRAAFKNFYVDWNNDEDPVASRVQVAAVGSNYVDFKFPNYSSAVRKSSFVDFIPLDPQKLTIGVNGGTEFTLGKAFTGAKQWVAEDTVRLTVSDANFVSQFVKVGNEYVLRHYNYEIAGVDMSNNAHLTLSNVVIYSSPGFGFLVRDGQSHWQLLNSKVTPRPNSNRIMSSTADHLHGYNTKGYFIIDGADFGYGGDDGINIHDNLSMGFTKVNANTITATGLDNWRTPYKAGDVIEFRQSDLSPTGFSSKVVSAVWNGSQATLTFEDNLPVNLGTDSILFNRTYDSGHYIIRNSYFHENRARGILVQTPNGLLENNRFYRNEQPGIQIETGYQTGWSEGFGASNVIFRGNVFDSTNVNTKYREKMPAIYMSVYLPSGRTSYPIFSNILFESNTFKNFPGVSLFLSSSQGVIVKDNTFINDSRPEATDKLRGGIYTERSTDLTVLNNKWVQSSYMKSEGITFDKATTGNIDFEGNSIVDQP